MPLDNIVLGLRGYKTKHPGGGNPVDLEVAGGSSVSLSQTPMFGVRSRL